MLKLHFINVGDGDAILAEDYAPDGTVFRLLVDAGPETVPNEPDSACCTAAQYLSAMQIHHLDFLVITHLHTDHFGGLDAVLAQTQVDQIAAGYFPPQSPLRACAEPDAQKTVRGMAAALNLWVHSCQLLREQSTVRYPVADENRAIWLTERLHMTLEAPDREIVSLQRRVWDGLLHGKQAAQSEQYDASKSRNPGSLRLVLDYCGRQICLAGDCYGSVWERDARPCDILKVPHHGDCKALTAPLVQQLRPRYAVISCGKDYIPRKDRPSAQTLALLDAQGTSVYFTDAYAPDGKSPDRWQAVMITIQDDGTILRPEGCHCSRGGIV